MMAKQMNLFIDQGADFSAIIPVVLPSGTPIPLSETFEFVSQFKSFYDSSIVFDFNVAIEDLEAGTIRLFLSGTNTTLIRHGKYLFDVKMLNPLDGSIQRIVEGTLVVTPQISIFPYSPA